MNRIHRPVPTALGGLLVVAACGAVQPGASPSPVAGPPGAGGGTAATAVEPGQRPYAPEAVRFMQQMIVHHAQALEMAGLVPGRTSNEAIHLLAERIEVSQQDEIALMQQWLRDRGERVPAAESGTHHGGEHDAAPLHGMLTAAELARLERARDAAFDRLFLEFMIRHHEGALVMVSELLAAPGATQDPEVTRLAGDVDADQRAEIRRMREMLER